MGELPSEQPPDAENPNPTFIQYVLQVARERNCDIDPDVLPIARRFRPLMALVEEQVGKVEFCAYPQCLVSNFLRGRLKRCERCMRVWYCGRDHQVAHWKSEHKQNCQRRTEVASKDYI